MPLSDAAANWLQTDNLISQTAQKYGLDPDLVHRVIQQESAYNPRAVSKAGAQGLMQLMPQTAQEMGVKDSFDPAQNVEGGAKYLASLIQRYNGDTNKALAAYNAGPGAVDSGRAASFPETKNYVARVGKPTPLSMNAEAFLKAQQPEAPKVQAKPQDTRSWFTKLQDDTAQAILHPVDTVVDNLPNIGGMVGSIAGGSKATPIGMAAAAIGGAAGKGYQTLIQHASELPGAIKDIATNIKNGYGDETYKGFQQGELQGVKDAGLEALKQGALEGGGRLVGNALKGAATGVTRHVFQPSEEALKASPTLVTDILEHGITPSKKGVAEATSLTNVARSKADKLVTDVNRAPRKIIIGANNTPMVSNRVSLQKELVAPVFNSTKSLVNPNLPNAAGIVEQGLEKTPGRRTLDTMAQNITNDNPSILDLERLQEVARRTGKIGDSAFMGDAEDVALRKLANADIHNAAIASLEKRVPGFTAANKETQRKLMMLKTVEDVVRRGENKPLDLQYLTHTLAREGLFGGAASVIGGLPGAAAGQAAGSVVRSPRLQAAVGRGLYGASKIPFTNIARVGMVANDESEKQTNQRKKAEIDALYNAYLQQK